MIIRLLLSIKAYFLDELRAFIPLLQFHEISF